MPQQSSSVFSAERVFDVQHCTQMFLPFQKDKRAGQWTSQGKKIASYHSVLLEQTKDRKLLSCFLTPFGHLTRRQLCHKNCVGYGWAHGSQAQCTQHPRETLEIFTSGFSKKKICICHNRFRVTLHLTIWKHFWYLFSPQMELLIVLLEGYRIFVILSIALLSGATPY